MLTDIMIEHNYFITVALDVVALQLLIGICLIPKYINGKDSQDLYVVPTRLYYILKIVEYIYLLLPVVHYMLGLAKVDTRIYLHPFSIYVPILVGELITIFTPLSAVYLGCSIGITFQVFSRIDFLRFEDKETSFYNAAYLKHILNLLDEGYEKSGSMIVFEIKGNREYFKELIPAFILNDEELILLAGE